MSTTDPTVSEPLYRLVGALVSWGATASQIVTHMERFERSGASCAQTTTVEAFTAYVAELVAPLIAGQGPAIERAASLIEAIDAEVFEQTLLAP